MPPSGRHLLPESELSLRPLQRELNLRREQAERGCTRERHRVRWRALDSVVSRDAVLLPAVHHHTDAGIMAVVMMVSRMAVAVLVTMIGGRAHGGKHWQGPRGLARHRGQPETNPRLLSDSESEHCFASFCLTLQLRTPRNQTHSSAPSAPWHRALKRECQDRRSASSSRRVLFLDAYQVTLRPSGIRGPGLGVMARSDSEGVTRQPDRSLWGAPRQITVEVVA